MKTKTHRTRFVVGKVAAQPGTRMEGHLEVGTMPDGTAVRLPIVLINGNHPGKTLYIQAISDGDELNGIAVVHKILQTITPEQLHGKIIAVPIVNFHAFHAKQALSPVDNRKMNRCFPGRRNGDIKRTDRLSPFSSSRPTGGLLPRPTPRRRATDDR